MKVALVTASSNGLGAAIARQLVVDMRVVINYFSSPERAHAVLADLGSIANSNSTGPAVDNSPKPADGSKTVPRVHAIQADLGKRHDIQRMVSETIAVMGRIDLVVSNGGWTKIRDFDNLDDNVEDEDGDTCFNINVKSHLHLLHAVRDHLDVTEGSFTTIASVAGVKPSGSSLVGCHIGSAPYIFVPFLAHTIANTDHRDMFLSAVSVLSLSSSSGFV